MNRNTNAANIDRREAEDEAAHLDHVLADKELARVVGGTDRAERADLQSFVVVKLFDKASP